MADESIINFNSLAQTLWNLELCRLDNRPAVDPDVSAALRWVAGRQGDKPSYRGALFAPTELDIAQGWLTPTGENASSSRAASLHVLGEEAARALALWDVDSGYDYQMVWSAIGSRFGCVENDSLRGVDGRFCCARCSVAWWRALAAGRPRYWEEAVCAGMNLLKNSRDGRWGRYPFYYTLLALADIPLPEATEEKLYARAAAERALNAKQPAGISGEFRLRAVKWALS